MVSIYHEFVSQIPQCPSFHQVLFPLPPVTRTLVIVFLLARQFGLNDFLHGEILPDLERQPSNPRSVSEAAKPVDMVYHQLCIVALVDVISRLPIDRVGMASEEARLNLPILEPLCRDCLQVPMQREARQSGGGVWCGNLVFILCFPHPARERVKHRVCILLYRPPSNTERYIGTVIIVLIWRCNIQREQHGIATVRVAVGVVLHEAYGRAVHALGSVFGCGDIFVAGGAGEDGHEIANGRQMEDLSCLSYGLSHCRKVEVVARRSVRVGEDVLWRNLSDGAGSRQSSGGDEKAGSLHRRRCRLTCLYTE